MTPTPDIDAALVARLKEGDMDALGTLYRRHGGAVRTVLLRADPAGGPQAADDLAQDTFLSFLDTLDRYEHRGRLRSWLYGIALRKARSDRRRWWRRLGLGRREGFGAAGVAAPAPAPDERLADRQRIDAAMASLPAAQREALVLVAVEGLAVAEAARVLGISENAVSTRLYRARKALEEG